MADEKKEISKEQLQEFLTQVAIMLRQTMPPPECATKPPVGMHPSNSLVYFSPAMQSFIEELGKDEIERLTIATRIHPKVLEGLAGMSEKEWSKFAKSMDFLATSSTALKVVGICLGACVSTLIALFGLAKAGIDFFSGFKGPPG